MARWRGLLRSGSMGSSDLLGAAWDRQDDRRPAARARHRICASRRVSAIFTGVADLKKVFEEASQRRATGQGHAAVRGRDPSLQPHAAGLVSAGDGGRHDHADRRDDGESFVRAERGAAVARAGDDVPCARRRGDREAAGARGRGSRARPCRWTTTRALRSCAHGGRRRARGADAGGGTLARSRSGRE
jgi:hypothetical protein